MLFQIHLNIIEYNWLNIISVEYDLINYEITLTLMISSHFIVPWTLVSSIDTTTRGDAISNPLSLNIID